MSKSGEQQSGAKSRPLSPEIAEELHMLSMIATRPVQAGVSQKKS